MLIGADPVRSPPARRVPVVFCRRSWLHLGWILVANRLHLGVDQPGSGGKATSIELSGYTSQAGQEIRVQLDDPFEGYAVEVTLRDGAGAMLKSGPATRTDPDQVQWIYQTRVALPNPSGILVEAMATDRPGNRDTRIQRLEVPQI